MKCIDTTFLIDFRKNNKNLEPIIEILDEEGIHAVPSIVMHEFLIGGLGSNNNNEIQIRKDILSRFVILPFDDKSALKSSEIEYNQRRNGNFMGTADIFIASTLLSHNLDTIVTRNVKHFERIPDVKIISWQK